MLISLYHSLSAEGNLTTAAATAAGAGDTDFSQSLAASLASSSSSGSTGSLERLSSSSPLVWTAALNGQAGRGALTANASATGLPDHLQSDEQRDTAQPLGDAYSTYSGGRFSLDVDRGDPERVGADIEQFHFAHLVEKDGTYYGYFIDHTGGTDNEVGLATSTDGVNFEYQGKVLTRDADFDAEQASFPSVAWDGDTETWYMLYEGKSAEGDVNSVCLATSADGVNWDKQGPVISPNDAGELSNIDVGTPTMFKEDGVWHVYFHTFADDGRVRIGYASGESLSDLTVKEGVILDTDASGIEAGTVGARSNVIKSGDYYYMAYEVCTAVNDFGQAEWGTNLARATSPDGPWEKMDGLLLQNYNQGFGCDGPELSVQDGSVYLYYRYGGNNTARVELSGLGEEATMAGNSSSVLT